jgi:hypothetical protein
MPEKKITRHVIKLPTPSLKISVFPSQAQSSLTLDIRLPPTQTALPDRPSNRRFHLILCKWIFSHRLPLNQPLCLRCGGLLLSELEPLSSLSSFLGNEAFLLLVDGCVTTSITHNLRVFFSLTYFRNPAQGHHSNRYYLSQTTFLLNSRQA